MFKISRKNYLFFTIILALCPSLASVSMLHFHPPFFGILFTESNWQKIQVGMSISEVWLVLGQPDSVYHYPASDEWIYASEITSYTSYIININSNTGVVTSHYIDEF